MLTEAEQASEKEEEGAGVLVRRKRGIAGGKENGSHQPEPVLAGEEQRSVYVNGDQGILSTGGTSGMQIREENLFIDDKDNIQVNGKKDSRIKQFRKLDNSPVSEEKSNHRSTDVILENGSTSNLTKGCDEFGVARSEFEVEEDTHVELGRNSKREVTEIDLEKVLEEQETHDLYCPNCNSCITKRVILRKRKRTVRETQCDTPTAKVQQLQHLDATAASADEMTELSHDREPDVFRCLSCFSFFIPTDAGFNIFRIFGRRGETENQVTSQLLPAKTGNIGSPVLKPVGSSSRASESDLPVSSASTIDSVQHMGELSTNIQTDPAINALGAISFGESQMTTKKNGADTSFDIFRIFGRRKETESWRTSQQLPAKNVTWNSSIFNSSASTSTTSQSVSGLPLLSGSTVTSVQQNGETSMNIQASSGTTTFRAVSVGKSQIATEKNNPGVQFGVEPNDIFGEDPSFKEKQRPLTNVVSDAIKLEEGQSTIGEMDADENIWDHFINDEKGNPVMPTSIDANIWEHFINDEKGNPAKGIIQRYLDKIESEDPNLGEGRTITGVESWINDAKQVGDLAKDSMQRYLDKTESEDPNLGKSQPIIAIGDTGIVGNPAKGIIQRYLDKIESEDPNLGKGGTITDVESWINDGKQVGDLAKGIVGNPAKGIIQRYRDKIESEDPNLGKGRTITDVESWINDGKQVGDLAKGIVDNPAKGIIQIHLDKVESEDPNLGKGRTITDVESWINDGKPVGDLAKGIVGNPAKGIIQRYLDKIESKDPNLGKGRTITDVESWINEVGDLAKGSMQRYLDKTESEDPNLGKTQPIIAIGDTGDDTVGPVDIIMPTFPARTSHSQFSQNINVSVVSTHETQIYVGEPTEGEAGRRRDWDVLKSIVYGGLIESVTSLSIVSSAAGGNASTLNIVALALAALIGGLFLIAHNISELRVAQEETTNQNGELVGRYWELLGRKANSRLHATIAVLSYILMGLLPPIIYGFSFRKSDDKEYKLTAVAASSLVCISLLAIGKAHVSAQRAYIKSLAYYLSLGYAASGISYVAGVMIHRLLDQLGLYDNSTAAPVPPSVIYPYIGSTLEAWASS